MRLTIPVLRQEGRPSASRTPPPSQWTTRYSPGAAATSEVIRSATIRTSEPATVVVCVSPVIGAAVTGAFAVPAVAGPVLPALAAGVLTASAVHAAD